MFDSQPPAASARKGKGPAVSSSFYNGESASFSLSENMDDDADEDEEDSNDDAEDSDDSEMDLSEMLQLRADELKQEQAAAAAAKRRGASAGAAAGAGDGGNAADESAEYSYDEDEDYDDADDEARHSSLLSSISGMKSVDGEKKKRGAKPQERGESLPEGTFNLKGSSKSLGLDDLIGSLKEGKSFGGLKQKISKMQNQKLRLAKPLSNRETKEITRKEAYKASKSEVSKWTATVKANREAVALSFPLNDDSNRKSMNARSSSDLVRKTVPTTDLEKQVAAILEATSANNVNEKKGNRLTADEELGLNNLDPQDRRARVRELQKLRALESYYASKCRRIKKIKSKSYHRIQKKVKKIQSEKDELTLEQLRELDPEAAKEKELKQERERVMNRAQLRHKNTSKWAKHMLSRKQLDSSTRQALGEQLNIDQELRKKITLDRGSDEDSDDANYDATGSGSDDGFPTDETGARSEVAKLRADLNNAPEATGVYAMQFMKKSMEKKRAAAMDELEAYEAELNGEDPTEVGGIGMAAGRRSFGGHLGKQDPGRFTTQPAKPVADSFGAGNVWGESADGAEMSEEFKGAVTAAKVDGVVTVKLPQSVKDGMGAGAKKAEDDEAEEDDDDDDEEDDDDSDDSDSNGDADADAANPEEGAKADAAAEEEDQRPELHEITSANPWLKIAQSDAGLTPQDAMTKFSKKADKRRAKLQRAARTKVAEGGEVTVDLALASVQNVGESGKEKRKGKGKKRSADEAATAAEEETPAEREAEAEAETEAGDIARAAKRTSAFDMDANVSQEQKEMIAMAFAGDNVLEEDFLKEKAKLVDDETNKDEDVTLPGWGSWGGQGVKNKRPQKRIIKKAAPQSTRKDSGKKLVIISERVQKKTQKKMVTNVPFPYTSKQQFERSIRTPTGKEWNSAATLKRNITPAVSTKAGAIIEPMRLTKSIKEDSKRRLQQKNAKKGNKRAKKLA